ncbi:MAG: ABC transporter ATP-binding protein [Coriobacteriales bacterium]|jgi:ABC-2 type transport system ATP-binding protein|nr:ABC transporter ATP-binding protein [Coriobacteriales bacterium]
MALLPTGKYLYNPEPVGDYALKISDVTMTFNMANEQLNSLKEYFLKLIKRELFFKEFLALKGISFEVKHGDVFGLVGTNGSGKSTMLKIIAGVLDPTTGTCEVNGSIAPLIELGAGFDRELTARENIYLNGSLLGYSRSYLDSHFKEIVDFAELWDFLDLPMKNYSSGMIARIAFAIATVIVPDILIVDETLSVGDIFFQEKCEARIKSLIEEHNTTVLFVSHTITQVERLCTNAIWIEKGVTQMVGDAREVCEAYRKSH